MSLIMLTFSKEVLLILVISGLFFSCDKKNNDGNDLVLIDSYQLSITEASGLSLSEDKKSLWTVSDEHNKVYNISLTGKKISHFKIDYEDLEGVTCVNDSTLAVVAESSNKVVVVDTNGNEIASKSIELDSKSNSGLEGITYDKENNVYYVVSEKDPSLLFKLDSNLEVIEKNELDFAKDHSAIFYDSNKELLWILSDESKALYKVTLDGKMIHKYNVKVPKAEGVAIDISTYKIYIVSDDTSKLYIFTLP